MRTPFLLLLLVACEAFAAPQDDVFLEARDAFQRGDIAKLNERAAKLDDDYALTPYVRYWQLRSRLADAPQGEIKNFLERNEGSLVADRLRADWLRQLARAADWTAFMRQYPKLGTADTEFACFASQARLAQGESGVLSQARPLWFTAQVLPESCLPIFKAMFDKQMLTAEDSWSRVRLALENGNLSGARMLLVYLPAGERPDPKSLEAISRRPQRYLDKAPLLLKTRGQRELAIYALYKTAESWPEIAADHMSRISGKLTDEEREYAWAQIASVAARNLHPGALAWFKNAGNGMNDRQLSWYGRAALRAGNWSDVLAAVSAMSSGERLRPQWRYWRARALAALGRPAEANVLLAPLSNEFNFYGQLAAEDLGTSISSAPQTYHPSADEVDAVAADRGIQRALALYRAGLRYEGALEWQWSIKDFDDKQLLAAAVLAVRNDWYERAIDTAERTVILHDFGLRYPAPYRKLVQDYAQQLDLDEAWVYGLVRQESRFVHTARSSAGASGLMQLMPATARWVAKRLGLNGHHTTLTETVDTNIGLGTYYLRQVLDSVDKHVVLASAGYNAGPRRARDWAASRPLEGAIYIETIPFPETREYVKKVMNNTLYYARLFHQSSLSLRDRLGVVPAKATQNN
ncbi:MAG TPA: transglycosylase SLT domain-containing protein [Burkholderiales bacterium]|nr:transglycosylase SLT domain-containing protein [Burkholderiales bacterium]